LLSGLLPGAPGCVVQDCIDSMRSVNWSRKSFGINRRLVNEIRLSYCGCTDDTPPNSQKIGFWAVSFWTVGDPSLGCSRSSQLRLPQILWLLNRTHFSKCILLGPQS
jgi:hypothetical protein